MSLSLVQFLQLLPYEIKTKIFYFTSHPNAISYNKICSEYYNIIYNKIIYPDNSFINRFWFHRKYNKSIKNCDYELRDKLIINFEIMRNKRIQLKNKYLKSICKNCEREPIFNTYDIYCTICIKKIYGNNNLIPKINEKLNIVCCNNLLDKCLVNLIIFILIITLWMLIYLEYKS